jgi:hypothetical protein
MSAGELAAGAGIAGSAVGDGIPLRAALAMTISVLRPGGPPEQLFTVDLDAAETTHTCASGNFTATLKAGPITGTPARRAVELAVACRSELKITAGLRVEVRLAHSHDPGWMIPGLFYGENRRADCTRRYPRLTPGSRAYGRMESGWWGFRADRAATPAVIAWDGTGGVALVTAERSQLGLTGLGLAWLAGCPLLRLDFPYREEPVCYDGSEDPQPADVRFAEWENGTSARVRWSVYLLGADRHEYADVLRSLPTAPAEDVAWAGLAEAAELTAHGLYRWHYRKDPPVLLETAAFDRDAFGASGDRQAMHVSWVSGTPYAYALLRHGRRRGVGKYVTAGTAVLENIAANLAPGGTFWGQWSQAKGWGIGWTPQAGRLHARTLADATLFQLRALRDEQAAGVAHPAWAAAVRSNLDVACRSQRGDGALGAAYHAVTGEVLDWRGSAALAWVAPLAEASRAFGETRYLDAAVRAGRYYADFIESGSLCGAPEDVDLAPSSEDGYLAVMSYVCLYREQRDPAWLRLARHAADWMLTFRYTYDVAFSPLTLLGAYGFRTTGADQASPPNQHLHCFGLICLPEMMELYRATGDMYLLDRTRENLACFRQFIARQDGDFDAYRGMVSERFYQTDCFQAKGMLLTLSHAWSVGAVLYACDAALDYPEFGRRAGLLSGQRLSCQPALARISAVPGLAPQAEATGGGAEACFLEGAGER